MTNWIDWQGGECPVAADAVVEVQFPDGGTASDHAFRLSWKHRRDSYANIVAYRVLPTFADLAAKDAEIERLQEAYRLLWLHGEQMQQERDRLRAELAVAREALTGLVDVIDAAGLHNLIHGVQLGPTVWYVKATDAMNSARAAIKGEA